MGLLSKDTIEAFQRDGYVVIDGLLTTDELDHFGNAVDTAVAKRSIDDGRSLQERSRYEQSFRQCINLWEDHAQVRPLTFHPRVAQAAAELLGAGAVRLWHDQALYKEAHGRATDAHQDYPYWPIAETDTVTAWIPFDGSQLANGAMGYMPGSHVSGLVEIVDIFGTEEPADLTSHPVLQGVEPVFVEVPSGSVAFHHGLTVHLAKENTTNETRRVHTIIYLRDGCTRGTSAFHISVDRPGIKVGDQIASDLTPIAWPRPGNDLPATPTPLPAMLANLAPPGVLPSMVDGVLPDMGRGVE